MRALVLVLVAAAAALVVSCGSTSRQSAPVPSQTQARASAYARCLTDLRSEHARWAADPSIERNPSSCDQPAVPYADYVRAFEAAGGPVWVTSEQPAGRP